MNEDILTISKDHRDALRALMARPEFESFRELCHIEENNIVIQAFKTPSSDPDLIRKKAHAEGRIFELRTILNTFKMAAKGGENE